MTVCSGRRLARAAGALAGRVRPQPALLRHAARSRGPGPRGPAGPAGRGRRRRAHRRRGRGDPSRPGPEGHLRRPRELVLPARPRRSRGGARRRTPARAGVDVRLGSTSRRCGGGPTVGWPASAWAAPPASLAEPAPARPRATCSSRPSASCPTPASWRAAASGSRRRRDRVDDAPRASAPTCGRRGTANVTWADGTRRRAALVYRPRPGPRGGGLHARRRRGLPPWDPVQLGQVLRPRVHDRRLGAGEAGLGQHAPRSRPRRADWFQRTPGPREPARRMQGPARDRLQHARRPVEPRGDAGGSIRALLDYVLDHLAEAQFDEELARAGAGRQTPASSRFSRGLTRSRRGWYGPPAKFKRASRRVALSSSRLASAP